MTKKGKDSVKEKYKRELILEGYRLAIQRIRDESCYWCDCGCKWPRPEDWLEAKQDEFLDSALEKK
jgi:hypothetical protein